MFPCNLVRFLFLRAAVQVVLPRAMRPWLLRGPIGYRGPRLVFCPHYLCPCTHRYSCLGLVYMGYVDHSPSAYQVLTLFVASANFLDGTKIEPQRILLAVYPLLYVNLTVLRDSSS